MFYCVLLLCYFYLSKNVSCCIVSISSVLCYMILVQFDGLFLVIQYSIVLCYVTE